LVSVTTAGGDFPQPRREPPAVPRFAPAKFEPGGIIEQSCGAAAPHRLTTKYLCTAPSRQLIWWKQAVRVCLSRCFLRSKRELHWRPPQFITGALYRSNAHLQHTRNFAAGITGSGICPLLYPLSYGSPRHRQESNLQPSEPDVTQAFTPQLFKLSKRFSPCYPAPRLLH